MEKKMETSIIGYMGSSQNEGPILVLLNIRCRNIIYAQNGVLTLATTHIYLCEATKHGGPKVRLAQQRLTFGSEFLVRNVRAVRVILLHTSALQIKTRFRL